MILCVYFVSNSLEGLSCFAEMSLGVSVATNVTKAQERRFIYTHVDTLTNIFYKLYIIKYIAFVAM